MKASKGGLLAIGLLAVAAMSAGSALADTITVTAYNTDGWFFSNTDNTGTNASGDYETGPSTPPLGDGSAQFLVNDNLSSEILQLNFSPMLASTLGTFSALSYYTYETTSTFGSGSAPTLQFDLFDSSAHYFGRLVFDPGLLGTVTHNSWQDWNSLSLSAWYLSKSGTKFQGACSISGPSYCSLSSALSHLSGLYIPDVLFKAGSGQSTFNGNVDDFVFNSTTYDFEVPEPGTLGLLLGGLALTGIRRRRKS